ncbi:MAG: UDP-N-acetylmuramate:L-alanyl-gamma-D-glutamyl-meso-diaminopimelate ligase [Porticoccus sp.]|nr:UDP-N-acetylmuramate:L-alanyl-gamma-D-glutamyl-meso-diaminopimelate ligase [Porticoccus sp.]MBQ0806911.1 UDP-N-acetylmuramate:L-alanyl-gamma-D-glutamyl-meso-diaminopimelate ligase [Porticoccus sp.]
MHIHILGICGTFMGSLAQLAKASGHQVSGSDTNVYPPMSTQLEKAGIELTEGYDPVQFNPIPDLVVIGNALSRGNPAVEYVLDNRIPYTSGPQWLGDYFLREKWVLAVAGTHGKTTTSSMLAWILDYAGMKPGFLIGGVPSNFDVSARLGDSPFFVVEADEYDSAFFDKRSKFVHYRPRTAILNNLEFDHADIFADLNAIQTQFHHFVRTIPRQGLIVAPADDANVQEVLNRGCWSELQALGDESDWSMTLIEGDGSIFEVSFQGEKQGAVRWGQTGTHNAANGLAAIAAARHVGVTPEVACKALCQFSGVKRRMEKLASINGVSVYDDFAHHPTAIATTLEGLRNNVGTEKIIAVIEPRSNTMKLGIHKSQLAESTKLADQVLWYQPDNIDWSLADIVSAGSVPAEVLDDIDILVEHTLKQAGNSAHIVIMSNGGFAGFHDRLVRALEDRDNG